MRIIVLDGHTLAPGDITWEPVAALGDLEVFPRTSPDEIIERAQGAQVLLTNKTRLTAATLAQLPDLQFIGVLATGYDVVDVTAAAQLGIPVCNVPGYGTNAVAQHVFALILELCRRTTLHDARVRQGAWSSNPDWCFWETTQVELTGKTMGIVGFGNIGQRVGTLANAFGMQVLAAARSSRVQPQYAPFAHADVDTLFAQADVISLHCPLTDATRGLVSRERLASMKPGAIIINTARGPLLDEQAVADALHSGHLGGLGADVVSVEPIAPDNPLLGAPRCIITPHMAWSTLTARQALMDQTARNIQAFQRGLPCNVVNAPVATRPAAA